MSHANRHLQPLTATDCHSEATAAAAAAAISLLCSSADNTVAVAECLLVQRLALLLVVAQLAKASWYMSQTWTVCQYELL